MAVKWYQTVTKFTNIFLSKALPKFTQIGISDLKINHLATLEPTTSLVCINFALAKSRRGGEGGTRPPLFISMVFR
jgi:hypothetical protein